MALPPRLARPGRFGHHLGEAFTGAHAGQAPERQPLKRDAQARRDVTDRVERAIIGHELDHVACARGGEPHAGGDGDAQIAPVPHADGRRAVHELRAMPRKQPRRIVADHPPVADGDELGARRRTIDGEMLDHARDVLGTARVLDVEEDGAPAIRMRTVGRRWRNARREGGLGPRQWNFGLVLDELGRW